MWEFCRRYIYCVLRSWKKRKSFYIADSLININREQGNIISDFESSNPPTWERNNNPQFNEAAFQKLVVDTKTPQFTLTPKKWIDLTNVVGITSKQGKGGGTMAHPFIACDFEMWNDAEFRYEVLKCVTGSSMDATDDPAIREKNEVE